jgi:hypothetical protein
MLGQSMALWDTYWHDDDEAGGDVRVEQVVTKPALQHEYYFQACEISWETMDTAWELGFALAEKLKQRYLLVKPNRTQNTAILRNTRVTGFKELLPKVLIS